MDKGDAYGMFKYARTTYCSRHICASPRCARLTAHRMHTFVLHLATNLHGLQHTRTIPPRGITTKIKKVALNMSDIEIKVEEATNNEPWGPHGTAMAGMTHPVGANGTQILLQQILPRLPTIGSSTGKSWVLSVAACNPQARIGAMSTNHCCC